jgi:arylsulfatase
VATAKSRTLRAVLVAWLLASLGCTVSAKPARDVLLISVDTLRADHLGAYGSELGLTPHLDALAEESLVFDHAYAPAPLTLPSITALLTGRRPETLGVVSNGNKLSARVPTLAATLSAHGYRTGAVVGSYVLRSEVGLARGFDAYDDAFESEESVRHKPERVADETTRAAVRMLRRLGEAPSRGRLLWVHYQDPHGPYTPPAGYREALLDRERARPDGRRELARGEGEKGLGEIPHYQFVERHDAAWYRAGYAGEVRFLDEQVGVLLGAIEAESLLEDPIIVFTGDHGEAMGERDYWFAHGEYLLDFQVQVPLLVRAPGVVPGRRADAASLLDVLPTLLRLVGAPGEASVAGRDLLAPAATDAPIYLTTLNSATRPGAGLVLGNRKYLRSLDGDSVREELFALGAEGEDLARAEPERLRALRAQLDALRAVVLPDAPPAPPAALSDEERQNLRALGYAL